MILVSGCFDGLHAGHIHYLEAAAGLRLHSNEPLVCALAPDEYIRKHKGREPWWTFNDRIWTLAALALPFEVRTHGIDSAADVIRDLRPRLFVKGGDWQHCCPPDVIAACQKVGTELRFIDIWPARHSSDALAS